MFESTELFPTPDETIALMLEPHLKDYSKSVSLRGRLSLNIKGLILDPQAGNGKILDYIKETFNSQHELLAIEIELNLRHILSGKGYRVIGSDFLAYDQPIRFGLIIMNPPFSKGAAHVLHAWKFVDDGGYLIALVNWETIANDYSQDRRQLKLLIEQYGSVENIGQCFLDAERPTDVEVGLIRLNKPKRESFKFDSANFDIGDAFEDYTLKASSIALRDPIAALVSRYDAALACVVARHQASVELNFYLQGIAPMVYCAWNNTSVEQDKFTYCASLDQEVKVLNSRFWNTVIQQTRVGRRTTARFKENFQKFCLDQQSMCFTAENIMEVLSQFFDNIEQMMTEATEDVFDRSTAFHRKNCVSVKGWAHNKAHKVAPLVIIPNGVYFDRRIVSGFTWFDFKARCGGYLNDFDIVLSYISKQSMDAKGFMGGERTLEAFCGQAKQSTYDEWFESTFFEMKMHKSGTLHLKVKDKALLDEFNVRAARHKKWIGNEL